MQSTIDITLRTSVLPGEELGEFWQLQGVHSGKQGGKECCHPDLVTPLCLIGSELALQQH